MKPMIKRLAIPCLLVVGLACGPDSAEEELAQSQELLSESREAVRTARDDVAARETAVETAKDELASARETLQQAQFELREAEAHVDLESTDQLLFRAIQRKLLDDERLEGTAIRAEVTRGNVRLSGKASDPEQAEVAQKIASDLPGVALVESRIEVPTPPVGAR